MSIPSPVPLGRMTVFLVEGHHLYIAKNDAWVIEVYGMDGVEHVRVYRMERTDGP